MKKSFVLRLVPYVLPMLAFAVRADAQQALPLVSNGNFAAQTVGNAAQIGPNTGDSINTTTYKDFRFFNVATASGLSFGSQIIAGPTAGTLALRLDVDNPGASAIGQYGFDIETKHIPITYGTTYRLSFDAAYIGGGNRLTVTLAEYDATGTFTGQQTASVIDLPSTDPTYHNYTCTLMPVSTAAASVNIMFGPGSGEAGAAALSLTNIRFGATVPGTGKPAASPKPTPKIK